MYFAENVTVEDQTVVLSGPVKRRSSLHCKYAKGSQNFEFFVIEPGVTLRLHGYHCIIHEYGDEPKLPSWLDQTYDDVQETFQELKTEHEAQLAAKPKKRGLFSRRK